jgi:two-component system phosphate regulon sensor histidine kinase PhoR
MPKDLPSPTPWVPLGIAASLGAAPASLFALLAALDLLDPLAATAAALAACASAVTLGWLWQRDIARLTAALKAAEAGEPIAALPLLAPLRRIAEASARLASGLRERGVEAAANADAAVRIVARLPDPLAVLGADARPVALNPAARALLGVDGADLAALLRNPGLRGAVDRALAGAGPQTAEITLPVPIERELLAQAILLDPPLADGGRLLLVLSDRTREKRLEQMRADFVANASHELRTPLTSLIGFIDTLLGPAADDREAQARFLPIMAEQASRMGRLIEDLLSLSRIELTEHTPPTSELDIAVLARRSAEALGPRLAARRLTLDLAAEEGLPHIVGDADQLSQVLANLLDNAVKYGREGGRIGLTLRRDGPGGEKARRRAGVAVAVADDGVGIPRLHIPRLTERFYRVDAARSRAVGGTGLGLAIVKHIVNRHRGTLEIESEEGHGSTFTVWLPAAAPPVAAAQPVAVQAEPR